VSIGNPLKGSLEDDCFTEMKNDSVCCEFIGIGLLLGESLLSKDGPTEEKCALPKLPYDSCFTPPKQIDTFYSELIMNLGLLSHTNVVEFYHVREMTMTNKDA